MEPSSVVCAEATAQSLLPGQALSSEPAAVLTQEQKNTVKALYEGAFRLQQDKHLREAAQIYEEILRIDAGHADSLHMLGMIAYERGAAEMALQLIGRAILAGGAGRAGCYSNMGTIFQAKGALAKAAICYEKAIAIDPMMAEVRLNLGLLQQLRGETEAALACYETATELKPELAEAWSNLGNLRQQAGQMAKAEADFHRALALKPELAETHYNLGNLCEAQGRSKEAEQCYRAALKLKPKLAEAWGNLANLLQKQERFEETLACRKSEIQLRPRSAEAHYNLGGMLLALERREEAVVEYREALALDPALTKARNNLGALYRSLDRPAEAVVEFEQIPKGDPEYAGAYNNLGLAYLSLGRHEAAEAAIRETLALEPELAEAWCNLGVVYHARNQLNQADEYYRYAQDLNPEITKVRMNRGMIALTRGDFRTGWQEYEWRWERAPMQRRDFDAPQWIGQRLEGQRVLLHAEQGYGDTLQFLRYLPMVQAFGGEVLLEVQPRMQRLARALPGVAAVFAQGEPLPEFDCHLPLMSLPTVLGTTLETVPANVPYLVVPEEARAKAAELDWARDGLRVGLVWQGNTTFLHDGYRYRSADLAQLAGLLEVKGAHFYSLQIGAPEAAAARATGKIFDLSDATKDMADTAAQIEHLDLVISVDTSVLHLAGALGKPTWVLLPYTADWRWMLERADTPWYPTMRLYRQQQPGQWAPVVEAVRGALDAFCRRAQEGRD